MNLTFNLPTLVTITAPTCAGKNFLLEGLISQLGFDRIVSTTDRPKREGEVDGLHYHFISTERSKEMEEQGLLAELVTYNGTRYGVTHAEMANKVTLGGKPPIVILEPTGLEIYRKYCADHGWQMFSIYVSTLESIRLERLVDRTAADITTAIMDRSDAGTFYQLEILKDIKKLVAINNRRLQSIIEKERGWSSAARWDVIADGTDLKRALSEVAQGVQFRNSRSEMYA